MRASSPRDLEGKVVVITGVTSGIGRSMARELARRGARVVAMARDTERAAAALDDIGREAAARLAIIEIDLASFASIRRAAGEVLARVSAIHALVNNAGAIFPERRLTVDRVEETFAVNHLGPFLFTHLLLDRMRASAPSRVVIVSSEAHRRGVFDPSDPMLARTWSSVRAYCNAKLAGVMFALDLAARLEGTGVTANAVHPGAVATAWGERGSLPVRLAWRLSRPFFLSPERGAEGPLLLATSPLLETTRGLYFFRTRPCEPLSSAKDRSSQRRLSEISGALTGLGESAP